MTDLKPYILLFRPHQYVKNIFVFAPFLFTFEYSAEAFYHSVTAFILFCMVVSGIYVFNDFMDIEEDKQHPVKKNRPLASGVINKRIAGILILVPAGCSLMISFTINSSLFVVLLIYVVLNIAYSIKLKHIVLVDIFIISTGFVLRVFAGGAVIDVTPSAWIIIMTFLLALFLAIAKRRDDILLASKGLETRKNIDGYNLELVNASMVVMAAVIIVSYILYTVSPEVTARMHSGHLYLTAVFVILGIMRYMQLTFVEEKSGSPTRVVLTDRFIQLTLSAWLMSFLAVAFL